MSPGNFKNVKYFSKVREINYLRIIELVKYLSCFQQNCVFF